MTYSSDGSTLRQSWAMLGDAYEDKNVLVAISSDCEALREIIGKRVRNVTGQICPGF